MEPIQKNFTKEEKIENGYKYNFDISKDGLYSVEIIASARSWWQNLLKIKFGDDDLAVKIDGIEFPKLNGKKGLFDGEGAWNGNNSKGLSKTNVFIINLSEGTHTLMFLVDQNPTLRSIKINKVSSGINYIPIDNNPAEDGDRRQWITVALANLPLKNLGIKAIAKNYQGESDEDDIKLIIDGKIQKNRDGKTHSNWYWCGRILKGQEKEFNEELDKEKGLHYIELWADRMPEVKNIQISVELGSEFGGENAKRIPTVDDPEWTGDSYFSDDTEQMILARAIWGEARSTSKEARIAVAWSIKNRLGTKERWDSYHHILLDPSQYSCFWEKYPDDPNLQALKNPLSKSYDYSKWKETYEIAGQVIEGEISDLTSGANHYYDDNIWKRPEFEIPIWIKNGHVILKIEQLNFLKVK